MTLLDENRVAIFIPSLRGGGAERVMVTLANEFSARGYVVDLVMASAEGPYLNDVAPSVRMVDLQAGRVVKSLLPLARYLRETRPKAMLSAMGHANMVALMARMLTRSPTRVVVSEHTTVSVARLGARGISDRIRYALIPVLYPRADGICAVSESSAADLARFGKLPPGRVRTIYNPFDLERIRSAAAEPVEHPWFEPGQPPVVLAIGRLSEAKDFSTLIRAFSRFHGMHAARLMILGEGTLRASLEALAAEYGLTDNDVQMPGFVANPFSYLARCGLFALSSRREGLPGALIEALVCGAPVVSTDCLSGPREILEGGRWGRLVSVADDEALAQAMADILDTPPHQLPDVRQRAKDFEQERAVNAYLRILGLLGD